jgi:dTDP-4-amino-4,6-dideoxygalactose transaminase
MLSTNDRLVFEKAILLGHYNRHKGTAITIPDLRPYAVSGTGLNLRMHPYAALMVLDQLPGYQLQLQERTEVATLVASRLRGLAGIKVPATPPDVQPSWYAFPFFLDLSNLGLSTQFSREWVLAALHAEGAVEYDAPGSTAPQNKYKFLTEQISDEVGDTSMIAAEQYSRTAMKMPVWYGPRRFEYAEQYAAALTKVMSHLSELTRGPASASELAGST